jgi:endogenous inhibitor of DNA gyrase (YacG/DUF329 family)
VNPGKPRSGEPAPVVRIVGCPTCGARTTLAASNAFRPFCSERCRMRDLGAWASESYRIPEAGEEEPGGEKPGPEGRE